MSFTADVKDELTRVVPTCSHCDKATLAAIARIEGTLLFSGPGRYKLEIATEISSVARLVIRSLHTLYKLKTELTVRRSVLHKTPNYLITVPSQPNLEPALHDLGILAKTGIEMGILPHLVEKTCCAAAYLRGAFLGSGFIAEPRGDFHFEITVESEELADGLVQLMADRDINARVLHRRNSYIVYLKSGEAISEFLAFVGAHQCALAMENERVRNASCEFDVDTLKPTYRLIIGLPGKSNAFAISQRLGIPASIIEEAKRCMSAERVQFEDMLSRLESAESTLEKEKRAAEKQRAEAERLLNETRRQLEAEREQAQRELKAAQDAAARILSNARESANYVFNELNELKKKQDRESLAKALEESRRSVKEALGSADIRLPDADETEDGYTPPRPFAHGDTVSVASLGGVQGTITRLEPPNAYVQAGAGNVKVKLADLRLVQGAKPKKEQKKASFTRANGNAAVRNELDLRGQYGDDAWFMADRFIDSAVMAGYETVTLIHGKGTGALRAALWQHLKNDRRVVSYRSGRYGEGDLGVTVCELKK